MSKRRYLNRVFVLWIFLFGFSLIFSGCAQSIDEPVESKPDFSKENAQKNIHMCALYVAERIKDSYYKPWMLSEVALTFQNIGRNDITSDVLKKAYSAALEMKDPSYKSDALIEIANVYTKIGDNKKALSILDQAQMVAPKINAYEKMMEYEGNREDKDLVKTVSALVDEKAEQVESSSQDAVYGEVVGFYLTSDNPEKAYDVSKKIKSPQTKISALIEISGYYLQKDGGSKEKIERLFSEIQKEISVVEDEFFRINLMNEYLRLLIVADRKDEAEFLIPALEKAADKMRSKRLKNEILGNLAESHVVLGDIVLAEKMLKKIDGEDARLQVLLRLFDKTDNEKFADEAVELASGIRARYKKASLLAEVSNLYIEKGDKEKALEITNIMNDTYTKPRQLAYLGELYFEAGQKEKAVKLLSEAVSIAAEIEDNFYKSWALAEIAVRYDKTGIGLDEETKKMIKEIVEQA